MGGGAYIWNDVSVSTCGGLIHGGLIFGGGGAYSRRFTVCEVFVFAHLPYHIFLKFDWLFESYD